MWEEILTLQCDLNLDEVTDKLDSLLIFQENNTLHVDAQVIEKVLSQAIQNWREVTMQC